MILLVSTQALAFVVQSDTAPSVLQTRVDHFLTEFTVSLSKLSIALTDCC